MEDFDSASDNSMSGKAKKAFEALKQSEEGRKLWSEMRENLKQLNERF
jgi:hypothetical protein